MEEKCSHSRYKHDAKVVRINIAGLNIQQMMLQIRVHCDLCKRPFIWKGPVGFSTSTPMVSQDGLTMYLPLDYPYDPLADVDDEDETQVH